MLKAQAKVCGVITSAAAERVAKDESTFVTFAVRLTVPGAPGSSPMEVFLSTSVDGSADDIVKYPIGKRILAEGALTFRKRGDSLYLNFHAETVSIVESGKDSIEGVLEFRGTVGNRVDARPDKKGKPFVSFSAFSTQKSGEGFEFTWVKFVRFDAEKPEFLVPKSKVEASGKMLVYGYNGRVSIECRYDEVKKWERLPFSPLSPNETCPF